MTTLLDIRNLHVAYGKVEAVHDVSLTVAPGTIVSVIGPNGAGKTTLLAAVAGLLPSRGGIEYRGESASALSVEQRVARGLILVPERRELFAAMSVADNLELGAFQRARRGDRAWKGTLANVYQRFPRLAERRDQLAGTLSGGERQMLAMGRALMGEPKLLMLDEPSLGLAPLIVREIFSIISAPPGDGRFDPADRTECARRVADFRLWLCSRNRRARRRRPERRSRHQSARRGDLSRQACDGHCWVSPSDPRGHRRLAGSPPARGQYVFRPTVARSFLPRASRENPVTDLSLPGAAGPLVAEARRLLLEPAGLDDSHLSRVLASIHTHEVDFADLYFQYSRMESWSLEEGIVKSGSFSIDRGVGIRAVHRDKQAFAYSDDIGLAALDEAAHAARAIGRQGQTAHTAIARVGAARALYAPQDPVSSISEDAKVTLLERLEQMARTRDPRVTQVMASLAGEYEAVLIARSDGFMAADVRPLVRLSLSVIVEENGRREQGSAGGGGRFDYELFRRCRARPLRDAGGRSGVAQPARA